MDELLKQLSNLEISECLDLIDQALSGPITPEQKELFKNYKFAVLISQGKYNDALAYSVNLVKSETVSNQIAYCNYKLGNLDSIDTCTSTTLNAQISFRNGDYEKAEMFYTSLMNQSSQTNEYIEMLKTNYNALVAFGLQKEPKSCSGYEGIYNASLSPVSHSLLEKAINVGREYLTSEGYEDVDNELAALYIQQAFNFLWLEGKTEESKSLNERVISFSSFSDPQLSAIAVNNILSASPLSSLPELVKHLRALKVLRAPDVEGKLSHIQKEELLLNSALVFLHSAKKVHEAKHILGLWDKSKKILADRVEIINAFILLLECKKSVGNPYKTVVIPFLEKKAQEYYGKSTCIPLALASIYVANLDNVKKALSLILSNPLFYKPEMINFLVKHTKDVGSLIQTINKALVKEPSSEFLKEELGFAQIRNGDYNEAVKVFESLKIFSSRAKYGLVMAYSFVNVDKANELASSLNIPTLNGIKCSDNIFDEFFKQQNILDGGKPVIGASAEIMGSKKKRKRCKTKGNKKQYDPAIRPDPERWIPVKLRKNALNKKRRSKDDQTKTQGALESSKTAGKQPSSASISTSSSSNQTSNKKKKGKGKSKW